MPASKRKPFPDKFVVETDLNISSIPRSFPKDENSRRSDPDSPGPERCKRLLRLFACIYAATMIVVLVVVHSRDDRHVGIQQFLLVCTAGGFYIIFYQVLSAKDRMQQWLKRNGPTSPYRFNRSGCPRRINSDCPALYCGSPYSLHFVVAEAGRSQQSPITCRWDRSAVLRSRAVIAGFEDVAMTP
jgi:hypothetical protein